MVDYGGTPEGFLEYIEKTLAGHNTPANKKESVRVAAKQISESLAGAHAGNIDQLFISWVERKMY